VAYFPPANAADAREMLAALGLRDADELFESIPAELRATAGLDDLPEGLDEADLVRALRRMAGRNRPITDVISFCGAGAYPYPTPAAASYAMSRGEFLTAYTPYQPEISQGTLTAIFEFQTWVSELAGMPVANASLYDGATALAEGILMGLRVRRKAARVYLAAALPPTTRAIARRYLSGQEVEIVELPTLADGRTDISTLAADSAPKVVAVGSPNGYGIIEDLAAVRQAVGSGDFLVVHTPDPHAWMLLKPPGAFGADVAVAEGQPLGVPPSFGGPGLGLFTTRDEYLRQMPGRVCGETVDRDGKRGFVLTLSTREQHIRREKATSNICSNQGVIALVATVTMSVLGPTGLRQRALQSAQRARALAALLAEFGMARRHAAPFFNEFVVDVDDAAELWQALVDRDIQLGIPLSRWDDADGRGLLVCATAANHQDDIDRLRTALTELRR
jgi:glycine dehydrogenase subunit 1